MSHEEPTDGASAATRTAVAGIVFAAATVLFLLFALRFYGHTVDDAFIAFRYARNWAQGHGVVFNPGERVEGYTSFLWVALLEIAFRARLDPQIVARLAGLIAGAATLAGLVWLGVKMRWPAWALWIAPVFVAVHPGMAVWATGGLETPLFACLVTWGVGRAAVEREAGALRPTSAILLALAALTRPEGPLVALLVLALARPGGAPRPSWRNLAAWGGVFSAVFVPYFVWRLAYYGYLFPNTYYAKVDPGGGEIARGLHYLIVFARATGLGLAVPLAGLVFVRRVRSLPILAGTTAGYLAYVTFVGGDGLPAFRFLVPVLGLLFVLVALGTQGWRSRRPALPSWALAAALAALAIAPIGANFSGHYLDVVDQDRREVACWKQIGIWFRKHAAPGDSLAVLPAGAMPYFSRLPTVDMLGLNDATIAHTKVPLGAGQAGHEKVNVAYVLRRSPTYVVLGVYDLVPGPHEPERMIQARYPAERDLLASGEFRRRYRAKIAKAPGGYFVYFEREAASRDAVARASIVR